MRDLRQPTRYMARIPFDPAISRGRSLLLQRSLRSSTQLAARWRSTAADLHAAVEKLLRMLVPSIKRIAANVCARVVFVGLALAPPSIVNAQTTVPIEKEEEYPNLLD